MVYRRSVRHEVVACSMLAGQYKARPPGIPPRTFPRGLKLGCDLWIDLREWLEAISPVLGEGKNARALAKLFKREAAKWTSVLSRVSELSQAPNCHGPSGQIRPILVPTTIGVVSGRQFRPIRVHLRT